MKWGHQPKTRNRFYDFLSETRAEMQEYCDSTPTHWNEREHILTLLSELYQLEKKLKNQGHLNDDLIGTLRATATTEEN
tara:strand:+ start:198 stop:434 length:237 start_codon:yes stop_codon:yes gene_type:complete